MDLNERMGIDHVIRVNGDLTIDYADDVYAPEVYVESDEDGQILAQDDADMVANINRQGWDVLNGWSGQSGYAGPIMHQSEYIGGALAEHILETPGTYVACAVTDLSDDADLVGWVILRRSGS